MVCALADLGHKQSGMHMICSVGYGHNLHVSFARHMQIVLMANKVELHKVSA